MNDRALRDRRRRMPYALHGKSVVDSPNGQIGLGTGRCRLLVDAPAPATRNEHGRCRRSYRMNGADKLHSAAAELITSIQVSPLHDVEFVGDSEPGVDEHVSGVHFSDHDPIAGDFLNDGHVSESAAAPNQKGAGFDFPRVGTGLPTAGRCIFEPGVSMAVPVNFGSDDAFKLGGREIRAVPGGEAPQRSLGSVGRLRRRGGGKPMN